MRMGDIVVKEVEIFTDGACQGNPGPGGWGAILRYQQTEKEISGGDSNTTNNRMELSAVIEAFKRLKEPCDYIVIHNMFVMAFPKVGQKAGRKTVGEKRPFFFL